MASDPRDADHDGPKAHRRAWREAWEALQDAYGDNLDDQEPE